MGVLDYIQRLLGGQNAASGPQRNANGRPGPAGQNAENFPFKVTAYSAIKAVKEQARLNAVPGQSAVLVGDDEALERLSDVFSGLGMEDIAAQDPAELIRQARDIVPARDIFAIAKGYSEADYKQMLEDLRGEIPDEVAGNTVGPLALYDLVNNKLLKHVNIIVLPTDDVLEVIAHMRWGGWNDNPGAPVHMAALQHWRDRYGAELVALGPDSIELKVAHRPQTQEEALALAIEHLTYCPDIVTQGVGSIDALAATLMQSDWWYFWWD